MHDRVVAENAFYAVIRQYGGVVCPAGAFWLADKRNRSYEPVESGSCIEEIEIILADETLIFKDKGEITAMYPIY